jgi:hypothetical protein
LACLNAIQFTSGARCQILWALSSSDYDDSEGSNLFREIKYLLEINFADYRVLHCTCNTVAQKLASTSVNMTSGSSLFWPDVAPEFVISLVAVDLIWFKLMEFKFCFFFKTKYYRVTLLCGGASHG